MMPWWKQTWIVARHELSDAVRSRRAAVMMVLYVAGAVTSINGFINVLQKLELQIAQTLGVEALSSAGAVTDTLWKSRPFRNMLMSLVGDRSVAMDLLSIPPIALIYGWVAFTFVPMLVMLVTPARVAEEIGSGAVRFVVPRCTRSAWCAGKVAGQSALVILALILSVAGAWTVARLRLPGMDGWAVAQAMMMLAGKTWIYAFAFVGLAVGIAQFHRSPNQATALGFIAWMVLGIVGIMCHFYAGPGIRQIWLVIELIIPQGHRMDLWRMDGAYLLSGCAFLASLGMCYAAVGYAYFSRRDV
ncbi:MAG: hypothetical protein A2498_15870 [Lentisphaerae bacterium RIFOXYC12_FULL_60_16]|nr:MAG: hypothetical protein A2498_15870 [Lentisphaerae bacterium RIFOXYC12_FULL_60_16]